MAAAHPIGVIGPNAVIQLGEALRAMLGEQRAAGLYAQAGCAAWFATPPDAMVDERRTAALHQALRRDLPEEAPRILAEAGRRTGDYILAHRIPKPAQWLLRHVPAGLAGPLLLDAITRHAWTFAGTGRFMRNARSSLPGRDRRQPAGRRRAGGGTGLRLARGRVPPPVPGAGPPGRRGPGDRLRCRRRAGLPVRDRLAERPPAPGRGHPSSRRRSSAGLTIVIRR